jgi:hypothetical protein
METGYRANHWIAQEGLVGLMKVSRLQLSAN